jgi:hypothetical protein
MAGELPNSLVGGKLQGTLAKCTNEGTNVSHSRHAKAAPSPADF